MHIMEGYLPFGHALGWTIASIPFVSLGLQAIKKQVKDNSEVKMMLGVSAAFSFVLSALKLPSLFASCSHPTGTGLGAILFGPWVMAPLGAIVLLFQALLLAHGGLSTLGANVFSMAIAGPLIAYGVYKISSKLSIPRPVCVFLSAFCGDFFTYLTTAFQLALAFPSKHGGFFASLTKFLSVFALTQIPLAVCEGFLTVVIINMLTRYGQSNAINLGALRNEVD